MTFEEWWCDESLSDEDNRHIGYEYAKEAWDYQDTIIYELEKKISDLRLEIRGQDELIANMSSELDCLR